MLQRENIEAVVVAVPYLPELERHHDLRNQAVCDLLVQQATLTRRGLR